MATGGAVPSLDLAWLGNSLKWFWNQANGAFGIALVSALAGSFAGAYGAQTIAEREQEKRRSIQELRATNAATALALYILNALLGLKRQHLSALVEKHKADSRRYAEAHKNPTAGDSVFTTDWETLPWPELPMEPLHDAVFNKMDAQGAAISLLSLASGSAAMLADAIRQRNQFIEEMIAGPKRPREELAALYFGVRTPTGQTDRRYPSLVSAIGNYADAAILFTAVLVGELIDHGTSVRERLRRPTINVTKADLREAIKLGLIPDPAEYADVLRGIGIDPAKALARALAGPAAAAPVFKKQSEEIDPRPN